MTPIKWYGPTVLLILTMLAAMLLGPGVARQIAWAQSDAKIRLIKEDLAKNSTLAQLSAAYRQVAQVVEPSVVAIQVSARQKAHPGRSRDEDLLRRFFGPHLEPQAPPEEEQPEEAPAPHDNDADKYNQPRPYGSGSGWVFDDQGHIVTNNHVVEGADQITVRFRDGTERSAKIVGTDPNTDVAVLKIDAGSLHPATMAEQPVEQGDIVFAFGSPFRFEFSMSQGIVSGKGRSIHILGNNGYEDFIQTDAAINPGNSGGPLCDIDGRVVGMNSAIASQTGAFNGLGFAIPVDIVRDVVKQLISGGRVVRGFLGIEIQALDADMAASLGYSGKGVLVASPQEGGPADKAGIRSEDIITKVNGKAVTTQTELRLLVADILPGTKVPVEIFRGGKYQTLVVTVSEMPAPLAGARRIHPEEGLLKPAPQDAEVLKKLGFESVATATPELATQLRMKFQPGVIIREIRPDSIAELKGLTPRVVVVAVMSTPVTSVEELVTALNKVDLAKGVRLRVVAEGVPGYVLLRLPNDK